MTELKRDFLSGEMVAISTARANRPYDFGDNVRACPFCEENIEMTADSILESENVRVIPNLFPALDCESDLGYGIHEVLIDTKLHNEQLHEFSVLHIVEVFQAIQNRLNQLEANEKIKYVQVFKNHGKSSGASLAHSHWQILGMSSITNKQANIASNFTQYKKSNHVCYLCEIAEKIKEQIVLRNEIAIAYVPEVPLYCDAVNIMTASHHSKFTELNKTELMGLAEVFKKVLVALQKMHTGIGYNICFQNGLNEDCHFHLQIIPRIGNFAGFELGTGCFINSKEPQVTVKDYIHNLG